MKKSILYILFICLCASPGLHAEQFDIHILPHTDGLRLYPNGHLGWGQYSFINNAGQVAYTKYVDLEDYGSFKHGFVWNVETGENVGIAPSTENNHNYIITAFNDHGNYLYTMYSPEWLGAYHHHYSLNNNNDHLYYFSYNPEYELRPYGSGEGPESGIVRLEGVNCLFLNDNRTIAGVNRSDISGYIQAVKISNIVHGDASNDYHDTYETTNLPTLTGYTDATVRGINNSDQIVGWSYNQDSTATGVLWEGDTVIDLGLTDYIRLDRIQRDDEHNILINDDGMVVCLTGAGLFLWNNHETIDLTDYIKTELYSELFPGDDLSWIRFSDDIELLDFSDYGILLFDHYNNDMVVVEIIPEPVSLFLLGLGGLFLRQRRK